METVQAFLSVLGGLLLRLGLPLLVTGLLVWQLRRLDLRWQREAEQQWLGAAGVALPTPCWETRQCSPERRATCPAYLKSDVPCWQVFRVSNGHMPEKCLSCVVFRSAPVPVLAPAQAAHAR